MTGALWLVAYGAPWLAMAVVALTGALGDLVSPLRLMVAACMAVSLGALAAACLRSFR